MKNKGFTLIELLAVITILAIILVIAIPKIGNIIDSSRQSAYESQIKIIEDATKKYIVSYRRDIDWNENTADIFLYDLQEANLLPRPLKNPSGGFFDHTKPPEGEGLKVIVVKTEENKFSFIVHDPHNPDAIFVCNNKFIDTRDNEEYTTVQIGNQCWMAENLRHTTTSCLNTTWDWNYPLNACRKHNTSWGTEVLYQWWIAMNWDGENPSSATELQGTRGLCPEGWYVPTDNDFKVLEMHLGMSQAQADAASSWRGTDQGDQLKDIVKMGGTNTSGFTALPSGYRNPIIVEVEEQGWLGVWWTSSPSGTNAWRRMLSFGGSSVFRNLIPRDYGYSVRCIKK